MNPPNPFHVDVEPDLLTMCREECAEVRGPLSCPTLGFICEMQRTRPGPRVRREIRYAASFVEAVRRLTGDHRWPLKSA